ncbi:alanine racemase [Mycolicibacterium tusciae]|uniref:Amino acid deaminase n=1 Tax=Mycolicibacterium tusciae TaxID=75922 RepID=A0A1X0JQ95_9MYCO|nr:alanine racemase [Mycolicibacterium tusciae]ORB64516.1 amino acid deaminase [Mycolicibacterium tusciae]
MSAPINAAAVAALALEPLDWRFKGLPASWWGRTPADVCAASPRLFGDDAVGPVCVLLADALSANLATMAQWCRERGVELAPHGKTHMAPQLLARQFEAGACAVTAATVSQVRIFRAFGVRDVVLANEVVDAAALRWLAAELDADADFGLVCWVDSVRGVELMTSALTAAGAVRPVDVCVEVGMPGGRTGCRDADGVDTVARAVAASPRLRLIGVAGYEAALGHDVAPEAVAAVRSYLADVRAAVLRLAPIFETDRIFATAGGSTYFDAVADALTEWPADMSVRTVLRSGCYLTHDDGLYRRTSPLREGLRPALRVWSQVMSRPEPDLAVLTMGRRDVSFDQDLPVPYGLTTARVVKLNDQHAYLRLGDDGVEVGDWVEFGISHPCTVFDKWPMIPVLDEGGRVVDLIRTFF